LGNVGKQRLSCSKVNISLFFHTKNTPPLLETVSGPLAVLHDSLQNCETGLFMLIYYVTVSQTIKLKESEISAGSDYLFIVQVLNQHIHVKSSRIFKVYIFKKCFKKC